MASGHSWHRDTSLHFVLNERPLVDEPKSVESDSADANREPVSVESRSANDDKWGRFRSALQSLNNVGSGVRVALPTREYEPAYDERDAVVATIAYKNVRPSDRLLWCDQGEQFQLLCNILYKAIRSAYQAVVPSHHPWQVPGCILNCSRSC